jgi:hypothetical protein
MIHHMMIILTAAALIGSLGASEALAKGGSGRYGNGTRGGYAVQVNPGQPNHNGLVDCGYGATRYNCYRYGAGW